MQDQSQTQDRGGWIYNASLVFLSSVVLGIVLTNFAVDDPRLLHNAWTYIAILPAGIMLLGLLSRMFSNRSLERSLQAAFLISLTIHLLILTGSFHIVVLQSAYQAKNDGVQDAVDQKRIEENYSTVAYEPKFDKQPETSIANQITRSQVVDASASDVKLEQSQQYELTKAADVPQPKLDLKSPELAPSRSSLEIQPIEAEQVEITARAEQLPRNSLNLDDPSLAARASSEINVPQQQSLDPNESLPDANSMARSADVQQGQRQPFTTPSLDAIPLRPNRALSELARPNSPRRQSLPDQPVQPDIQARQQATLQSLDNLFESQQRVQSMPRMDQIGDTFSPSDLVMGVTVPTQGMSDITEAAGPITDVGALGFDRRDQTRPSDQLSTEGSLQSDSNSSGLSTGFTGSAASGLSPMLSGPRSTDLQPRPRGGMGFGELGGLARSNEQRMPTEIGRNRTAPMVRVTPGTQAPTGSTAMPAPAFAKRAERNNPQVEASDLGQWGPQTEAAIESGLAFLSNHQRADGSWALEDFGDRPYFQSHTAATALALLAFQGAGYSHMEFQYQTQCDKAIRYLVANQKTDGNLYILMNQQSDRNGMFYSHSIAALALCEAFGMTQDERLREPAQRAIDYLIATQDPIGGSWRYAPRTESDTSVTGWCMMAFKSAELSGLKVDPKAYIGIERHLQNAQASPQQRYLYRYNPSAADTPQTRHGLQPTPTMTSVGLLARLYLGWRRDNADMVRGADYILQSLPEIGTVDEPKRDTYYWYYATQVIFHMGGDYWKRWNQNLHPMLIQSQIQRGPMEGSWDAGGAIPDRWGVFAGRLYVTTMNLLSLEVYYRHLPIYEDTAR